VTTPAAVLATLLLLAMALFQASLAAGAPFGAHVLGGGHPDRLPGRLRLASGIAAALLIAFALVVLARAGVIDSPTALAGPLGVACWAVAGFLVLNTLGNLTSKGRLERTLFAAATAALAVLSGYVALSA